MITVTVIQEGNRQADVVELPEGARGADLLAKRPVPDQFQTFDYAGSNYTRETFRNVVLGNRTQLFLAGGKATNG